MDAQLALLRPFCFSGARGHEERRQESMPALPIWGELPIRSGDTGLFP